MVENDDSLVENDDSSAENYDSLAENDDSLVVNDDSFGRERRGSPLLVKLRLYASKQPTDI